MAYCFTEHGILPSEFRQIPFEDKVIMVAALQDKAETIEKERKKTNKNNKSVGS